MSSALPLPAWTRLIFELALAAMLFELGGRVRLGWFRHNPWVLLQALLASAAAAVAVYYTLTGMGFARTSAVVECSVTFPRIEILLAAR